ncbi:hypothetical protein Tco_1247945 [Tanacetum coccineum]
MDQDTMGDTIAQTRFENVSKTSNDSLLVGVNTPRIDEDSLKLKELMALSRVESSDDELSVRMHPNRGGKFILTLLERLARDKDEANVSLNEEWNDIQAKIKTDYELAQRMQAKEQEELSIEEKATLFQQLLEKRRKHFAAKRVEDKRNRPPIKAQQKSIIAELVKKSSKKAQTEKQEGSSKRAGYELEQEVTKKKKIDDDQEAAKMKELMEIIPNEEEVAIDAIPLATKPPSIVN